MTRGVKRKQGNIFISLLALRLGSKGVLSDVPYYC